MSPRGDRVRRSADARARDEAGTDRWTLVRDMLTFQLKLFLDGARDVVLFPVSLLAGVFDLLTRSGARDGAFYALMRLGRRTDQWIELFSAAGELGEDETEPHVVDQVLGRVEEVIARNLPTGSGSPANERPRRSHRQD